MILIMERNFFIYMNRKRFFAILTAALLLLFATACLVPNDGKAAETTEPEVPAQVTEAPQSEPAASGAFDGEAIAIELGDITVTANEVANVFDSYIGMFSYSGAIDRETVDQCFAMVEDELVRYYLPLWKAKELGVTLSDADTAEIEALTRDAVEEERGALLCQFAYYYGATEEYVEDATQLTDEEIDIATDGINEELAEMFYEGFVFEDYLNLEYDSILESYQIDRLNEALRAKFADTPLDAAQIDAWYEETLSAQQTLYSSTPADYYTDTMDYADGFSETPVLYAPDGYVRVQVVEIVPDGEPDPAIAENQKTLSALEAEYGKLLLSGAADETRKAEIEAEYAALKAENDAFEAAYYGAAREKIERAYADLQNGDAFESVMKVYNLYGDASGLDERLVYVAGTDTHNGEIADIAKTLEVGAYSAPVIADGSYVIVKLIERIPEGPVDRAAIEEQISTAARTALADEAWEEQFDTWLEEARAAAVFHRETYEAVGDMYLDE